MTRDEAIALYLRIPEDGSGEARRQYRQRFAIGRVADSLWDDPAFTLGVEYGMLIALQCAFDLSPGDIWPTAKPEAEGSEGSG